MIKPSANIHLSWTLELHWTRYILLKKHDTMTSGRRVRDKHRLLLWALFTEKLYVYYENEQSRNETNDSSKSPNINLYL